MDSELYILVCSEHDVAGGITQIVTQKRLSCTPYRGTNPKASSKRYKGGEANI
jgi:hypothetical protein